MRQLPFWIAHYNEVHPYKALGYRSRVSSKDPDRVRSFGGYNKAWHDASAVRPLNGCN
jgi:hypothetical protein